MLKKLLLAISVFCLCFTTQTEAAEKPDKAVLINSLPDAGHIHASLVLSRFFDSRTFLVCGKSFPEDKIVHQSFIRFVNEKDDLLAVGFLPTSQHNIDYIRYYLNKVFLMVRDPREALIAHMNYVEKHQYHRFTRSKMQPDVPDEYFSWDFARQADWQIQNFYQSFITFIDNWAQVQDTSRDINVYMATTEDMVNNQLQFFKDAVAFYGVDSNQFTEQDLIPLTLGQYHFYNSEDLESWRTLLTPEQQAEVTSRIPDYFFGRFGWNR